MNKSTAAIALLVPVLLAGGGYLYWQHRTDPPGREVVPALPAPAAVPEPPAIVAEVPAHYPIETPAVDTPQSAAIDPEQRLLTALQSLFGAAIDTVFETTDLARRIVVTVDNLPRDKVARRLMPLKPVPGAFAVSGSGDARGIDPANAMRYRPYVDLMYKVPTAALVDVYVRNYALFQQRYVELGYPEGYFNNRLVEVLDHLLASPEHAGPLRLSQPKVLYTFADPALEGLSEGQKIMLRMGPDNAARVKARLREIRTAVTQRAGGSAQDAAQP